MGDDFQNAYNSFYITFNSDNTAIIQMPQYEWRDEEIRNCNYGINGNSIILSIKGNDIGTIKIDENKLILDKDIFSYEIILIKK